MKNKMVDLHNHLFAELERLGDEDLKGEKLAEEITRAGAICNVAVTIIANGNLMLKAYDTVDASIGKVNLPLMLEGAVSENKGKPSQNTPRLRAIGAYGETLPRNKASNE